MMTPQEMLDLYSEMGKSIREQIQNIALTGLKDTPSGYLEHAGNYLVVNDDENGINFTGISKIAQDLTDFGFAGGGSSFFTGLKDTPTGYKEYTENYFLVPSGNQITYDTIRFLENVADAPENQLVGGFLQLSENGKLQWVAGTGTPSGSGNASIPRYTTLPDATENDSKIVASGCDLYYGCDGEWKKIGGESASELPSEAPRCVTNLTEYNQYQEYKDSIVNNVIASTFEDALNNESVNPTPFYDVCLFTKINELPSTPVGVSTDEISAGGEHSVFLQSDDTVFAVGGDVYGQLGNSEWGDETNLVSVVNNDGSTFKDVSKISAHARNTLYLKNDGSVWTVGRNDEGQLGVGFTTSERQQTPVPVTNSDGSIFNEVIDIAMGGSHAVYLKNDGTVWGVGAGRNFGDGESLERVNPVQVKNADGTAFIGVTAIAASYEQTFYLKNDGSVWGAGENSDGQLGDGTTTTQRNPAQVKNEDGTFLNGVTAISCGHNMVLFLKNDGTVLSLGTNYDGRLGDGTDTDRSHPVQVKNADGTPFSGVIAVSTFSSHSLFLKSDGTVFGCGGNAYGQLGNGTVSAQFYPVQVVNSDGSAFSDVVKISAGYWHSLYQKNDNTVWSSGYNAQGQLGIGTKTAPHVVGKVHPVQVNLSSEPSDQDASVKVVESGYPWGIVTSGTVINIQATAESCTFVEWQSSDTSIQDSSSATTTATINKDTSITGVFNC